MYEVTIAIPVYNVERMIEMSLVSALNQTYESIEFLIIDDKGSDNSMDVVNRIKNTHPRGKDIRIIDHGNNKGTGATKNTAIQQAKGKYLYFMDSDDIITDDCVEILYNTMRKYDVDVVLGSHSLCNSDSSEINKKQFGPFYKKGLRLVDYIYKYGGHVTVYTWNKLYKIDFLRRNSIMCIPHHLCEDVFFSFQVGLLASCFAICDKVTYKYFVNPNSLMGRGFDKRLSQMFIETIEIRLSYAHEYNTNKSISRNIYGTIINNSIWAMNEIDRSSKLEISEKQILLERIINAIIKGTSQLDYQEIKKCNKILDKYKEYKNSQQILRIKYNMCYKYDFTWIVMYVNKCFNYLKRLCLS